MDMVPPAMLLLALIALVLATLDGLEWAGTELLLVLEVRVGMRPGAPPAGEPKVEVPRGWPGPVCLCGLGCAFSCACVASLVRMEGDPSA